MNRKLLSRILFSFFLIVIFVLSACSQDSSKKEDINKSESNINKEADGSPSTDNQANLPSEIKNRGKFIVGVKVDYPPMGFLNERGENEGFEIDLVKRIAEAAFGDEDAVEFVPVTASNRIPYLTSNKIDFIAATMGITEERKKEVDFSMPTFTSGVMTLVPEDSSIEDISDLAGEKIITIKGTT